MFSLLSTTLSLLLVSSPLIAMAQMSPLTPTGATGGQPLTVTWTPDTTNAWGSVTMSLMSGDNFQMVNMGTLATGINGISTSSITVTIPAVTPAAPIYFLQFQPTNNASAYEWTTRFLINSADGSPAVAAPNATQPNGAAIAWGVGTLVDPSALATTNSSTSASASGIAVTGSSTQPSVATPSVVASNSVSVAGVSGSGSVTRASSTSRTSTSASASASARSSAGQTIVGAGVLGLVGLVVLLV